jgi:hypothetical protein
VLWLTFTGALHYRETFHEVSDKLHSPGKYKEGRERSQECDRRNTQHNNKNK